MLITRYEYTWTSENVSLVYSFQSRIRPAPGIDPHYTARPPVTPASPAQQSSVTVSHVQHAVHGRCTTLHTLNTERPVSTTRWALTTNIGTLMNTICRVRLLVLAVQGHLWVGSRY